MRHRFNALLLTSLIALITPSASRSATMDFDDIEFWAGAGSNRAAVVIDWSYLAGQGDSTVWGYRWDGEATGSQMLQAVLAADSQLYAKLLGTAGVVGFGYDAVGSAPFALDDNTVFDGNGIAQSEYSDGAIAIDPADRYVEGWYTGFWLYSTAPSSPYADESPASWTYAQGGMQARTLTDGAWDGWTFDKYFTFAARPDLPTPAPASLTTPSLLGDYNVDGVVNLADYSVFRDSLGQTPPAWTGADGTGDGLVNAADYGVWKQHFGESLPSSSTIASAHIPEPGTLLLICVCLIGFVFFATYARR